MKKYFILAAAALVTLASCMKNNVETSGPKEISYNAVAAKNTVSKAIISTAYYAPTDPAFGIWGLYQATNWSTNKAAANANIWVGNHSTGASAQISNTTGDATGYWKNATTDYWPLSGTLVFMGYSPYAHVNSKAAISVTDTDKVTLTVTNFQSETGTWVDDLMYSDPVEKTENDTKYQPDGSTNKYDGVPVVFHHALSQITVLAKKHATYSGYTLKITDISLYIDDKATLTAKAAPDNDAVASWTEASNAATATILDNDSNADLTEEYVQQGSAILVIPQTLEASHEKLTITYTLTHNGITSSATKNIDLFVDDALESLVKNTKYNLKLDVSLDEILYSPDVTDWDGTPVNQVYDVPEDAS